MSATCGQGDGEGFRRGLAAAATGRRTLLKAGGAGLLFSTMLGAPASAAGTRKRAYVVVVDGCRPDEITAELTPRLHALRQHGLNHPRARSVPIAETIPNHVMMMTGVRPDRSGVPANSVYDRGLGEVRDLDRPSDLKAWTVLQRLNAAGLTTGTVLSKEYLYGIFGTRATHRWEPAPIIPVSGHAPDVATMDAAVAMIEQFDPHLVFVNLGDIDRFGHADYTGTTVRAQRQLALADTDRQVGRLLDLIRSRGQWQDSIVMVLADHSMDWSTPGNLITLFPTLDADPMLAGRVQIADNGGADLVYWTGRASRRDAAVARIQEIAQAQPGVLAAYDRRASWLRLGPEAGDVVVYCKAGWRFSDPAPLDNPIPGNHGHPATLPIPFFIGGGHPVVPRGATRTARARTMDVAPTLARYFGVGAPTGGYDGRSRLP